MQTAGTLLRGWRERRRLTQMDLALQAQISPRHLSFVETGRAQPSREMLMHLSRGERPLDDPALAAAREAIDLVLDAQKPFPAFALDRHWNIVASNGALPELYDGVAHELLRAPMNAIRLSLHPRGLAPRIANLAEWRAHLISRLRRQIELTADPGLEALAREFDAYGDDGKSEERAQEVLVPLRIRAAGATLSFFSTTTVFGTPVEVTLSEIAIESFFAADAETTRRVRGA